MGFWLYFLLLAWLGQLELVVSIRGIDKSQLAGSQIYPLSIESDALFGVKRALLQTTSRPSCDTQRYRKYIGCFYRFQAAYLVASLFTAPSSGCVELFEGEASVRTGIDFVEQSSIPLGVNFLPPFKRVNEYAYCDSSPFNPRILSDSLQIIAAQHVLLIRFSQYLELISGDHSSQLPCKVQREEIEKFITYVQEVAKYVESQWDIVLEDLLEIANEEVYKTAQFSDKPEGQQPSYALGNKFIWLLGTQMDVSGSNLDFSSVKSSSQLHMWFNTTVRVYYSELPSEPIVEGFLNLRTTNYMPIEYDNSTLITSGPYGDAIIPPQMGESDYCSPRNPQLYFDMNSLFTAFGDILGVIDSINKMISGKLTNGPLPKSYCDAQVAIFQQLQLLTGPISGRTNTIADKYRTCGEQVLEGLPTDC